MTDFIEELEHLYATKGSEPYGEDVSVSDHGLQCAALALAEDASDTLVAAALLHDVGHLIEDPDDGFGVHAHDKGGAAFLAMYFPDAVVEPVRLHVAAKRYRVAVEPDYAAKLSPASTHTLAHQGGPMSDEEVAVFAANPFYRDAIRVREWDDRGKVEGLVVPPFEAHRERLRKLLKTHGSD